MIKHEHISYQVIISFILKTSIIWSTSDIVGGN